MKVCLLIAAICLFASCSSKQEKKPVAPVAVSYTTPEERAVKKAVDEAYRAISFKQGEKPDYNRIRNCFIPQTQFLNFRSDSLNVLPLEPFIKSYKGLVESGTIKSFFEEEVFGKTEQFGKIAQRISTYKTYINKTDTIAERGVNSFQLVKTPAGWRVSNIIWDVEKQGHPIPNYYLQRDSTN